MGAMNIEGNVQLMDDDENLAGAVGYAPDGANQYMVQQHPGVDDENAGAMPGYGEEDDALEDEEDDQTQ